MKKYLKLLIGLSFFSIIGCQNQSSINPTPLTSKKIMDKSTPITLIGGELGYDFVNSIDNSYKIYGVKINPKNNNIIVYGDSSKIVIYNTALQIVKELNSKNGEIRALDISQDGNYLACSGDDGYIDVWDLSRYKKLYSIDSDGENLAIAISTDNKKLAVGGEKKVIDIYDLLSQEQLARLKGHNGDITNLGFIDYNRKIVSTAKDKLVKLWNVNKKKEIYSYLAPSNEYGEIKKAKSFDDYTILALTEVERAEGNSRKRVGAPTWKYTIKFKDNQGNTLKEFNEHREPITDIAVAGNRAYMATSSKDKTIRLWDLEKKKHITNIVLKDRANGVAINRSGYILATIEGDNRIKLYQITNEYDPSLEPSKTSNEPTTVVSSNLPTWYKNQYAIVVGIDHYKNLSIPTLNNAVKDARSVAGLLRKKGFKVIELYNENATKEKILDALKRVKELATKDDATLFYFAGHGEGVSGYNGVREGYILPYDFNSDLNNPNADVMYYDKSAISIGSLIMYARDTKAKHLGILLDSCFSGLAMDSKYAKKSLGSSTKSLDTIDYDYKTRSVRIKPTKVSQNDELNNLFRELLQKKSINILTAGDDQPVADGSNHSPFTQAFLDALSGKAVDSNGFVRFSTLAEFIKKYVESKTKERQKPQYKNESLEGGDFIFKI